jgi:hypothetical protein
MGSIATGHPSEDGLVEAPLIPMRPAEPARQNEEILLAVR